MMAGPGSAGRGGGGDKRLIEVFGGKGLADDKLLEFLITWEPKDGARGTTLVPQLTKKSRESMLKRLDVITTRVETGETNAELLDAMLRMMKINNETSINAENFKQLEMLMESGMIKYLVSALSMDVTRADVIRVKQLVVEMLMDLVLVENVEYSTSVAETAMAPLMNIVSDTSDVAATMLLKKDSIDLIKKLNEQFIAWDAEGVATGNTADIGFGSDTNAQHKTAVALFASIPKIGDFLVQMDIVELLMSDVPRFDPAKIEKDLTKALGHSCFKQYQQISADSFEKDTVAFLAALNESSEGAVVIVKITSIKYDGVEQLPPDEFADDRFVCFNTTSQCITFPVAHTQSDDDSDGGYDWIELDRNGVASAMLSRGQRLVELRIVDHFDEDKVSLPPGTSAVSIDLSEPMQELPVFGDIATGVKQRLVGGRQPITTQVSTPITAPLHTPKPATAAAAASSSKADARTPTQPWSPDSAAADDDFEKGGGTRYTPLQIVRTTPNSGKFGAKSRSRAPASRVAKPAAAAPPVVMEEEDPVQPDSPLSSIASPSPVRGAAANYARGLSQSMDKGGDADSASSEDGSPPPPPRSKRASAKKAAAKIASTARAVSEEHADHDHSGYDHDATQDFSQPDLVEAPATKMATDDNGGKDSDGDSDDDKGEEKEEGARLSMPPTPPQPLPPQMFSASKLTADARHRRKPPAPRKAAVESPPAPPAAAKRKAAKVVRQAVAAEDEYDYEYDDNGHNDGHNDDDDARNGRNNDDIDGDDDDDDDKPLRYLGASSKGKAKAKQSKSLKKAKKDNAGAKVRQTKPPAKPKETHRADKTRARVFATQAKADTRAEFGAESDDDEESDTNSLGGLPAWEKLPELGETRSKRAALGARTRERKASKLVADSSQSSQSSVDEPAAPPPRATSRGRDVSDKRKSDDVSDDENGFTSEMMQGLQQQLQHNSTKAPSFKKTIAQARDVTFDRIIALRHQHEAEMQELEDKQTVEQAALYKKLMELTKSMKKLHKENDRLAAGLEESAATLVELEQWVQEHFPQSGDGRAVDADLTEKDLSRIETCTAKLGERVKKALAALQSDGKAKAKQQKMNMMRVMAQLMA